ncbi:MAG: hypothetical protein WCO48_02805 [Candidatus Taylorbacteria bacterium]
MNLDRNNESMDTTLINPQEQQRGQIIAILKMGGIENVSLDTADGLMRGTGVGQKDQIAIMSALDNWQKATTEAEMQIIANELVEVVKKGQYLRLKD